MLVKDKLKAWADIKDTYNDRIILGNGASIAIHDQFEYPSIFKKACDSKHITSEIEGIFNHFETNNFEQILQLLLYANIVNRYLEIKDSETSAKYQDVKNSLIQTIKDIHPEYSHIEENIICKVGEFLAKFNNVINLNYDLLVYWSILKYNNNSNNYFKDCFLDDKPFTSINTFLRRPYGKNKKAVLVLYPHGNLFIAYNPFTNEVSKIHADPDVHMLNTITDAWGNGESMKSLIPVFVSEGTSPQKLNRIKSNAYLSAAYNEISTKTDNLTIYGWSCNSNDQHILEAIKNSSPKRIAVSVLNKDNWRSNIEYFRSKLPRDVIEIDFFNAQSQGCWIY
ncbi:hypothetical protein X793_06280 [Dehalococcoides mccartyi CG4]|nr:hypothetical protein X793_06280 [Dehalococcoides mccartyi CG4]